MRAILSVSDKTGLADFGRGLAALGVELVSTGGTATALAAAGLPVVGVSDVTGFPEMMDGRVKTLHPAIHAGILARRPGRMTSRRSRRHGITPVDLVVVNLYPFARAAQNPETPFDALVEEIDIGGPSLVRAAAKNFRDVLVVVDPADYAQVLDELRRPGGPDLGFRFKLMQKAFAHTGHYDSIIAATLRRIECANGAITRSAVPVDHPLPKDLRYGENPHQKAQWVPNLPVLLPPWEIHQGKELSFTNLLDLDAAVAYRAGVRRTGGRRHQAHEPVRRGDSARRLPTPMCARARPIRSRPSAASSASTGTLDAETARALTSTFIEAVIAPAVADEARPILATKANLRVATVDFVRLGALDADQSRDTRTFLGGILRQDRDVVAEAHEPWPQGEFPKVVTKRTPTAEEWIALRFAWRVCGHVKSNAVIFTNADRTLAVGAGQMSRVDAVKVAVMKAGPGTLANSVAASDAFFPFRDGLDAVADAGATAVVQPGGSVRDAEVIAAADERGLAMVFTGKRHFRH